MLKTQISLFNALIAFAVVGLGTSLIVSGLITRDIESHARVLMTQEDIEKRVVVLETWRELLPTTLGKDRWRGSTMKGWVEDFQAAEPDLNIPDPDEYREK